MTNSGGGQFTYTPNSGFAGYDSFKVTINDGNGGLATQTVNVGVAGNATSANQAPQTVATQLASTDVNTAVAIKIEANDPDGDPLTFTAGAAGHGTITGGSAGAFSYKPTNGYVGFDSFDVTVSDGRNGTAKVAVTVLVDQANGGTTNHAPVVDLVQTTLLDSTGKALITIAATDADGDALTFTAATAAQGVLTGGANGMFTYTANPTFANSDKFTVTVSDGKGGTATQEITVLDNLPEYQLLLATGFKGSIGGNGSVLGQRASRTSNCLTDLASTSLTDHSIAAATSSACPRQPDNTRPSSRVRPRSSLTATRPTRSHSGRPGSPWYSPMACASW